MAESPPQPIRPHHSVLVCRRRRGLPRVPRQGVRIRDEACTKSIRTIPSTSTPRRSLGGALRDDLAREPEVRLGLAAHASGAPRLELRLRRRRRRALPARARGRGDDRGRARGHAVGRSHVHRAGSRGPSVVLRDGRGSQPRGGLRARPASASPSEHRPLLIAIAERLAAERYRGWAKEADDGRARAAAARVRRPRGGDRGRVEALFPGRRGDPARDAREASRSRGREPIGVRGAPAARCSSGSRRKASASAPPPGAPSPGRRRAASRATSTSPARSWRKPARSCSNPLLVTLAFPRCADARCSATQRDGG